MTRRLQFPPVVEPPADVPGGGGQSWENVAQLPWRETMLATFGDVDPQPLPVVPAPRRAPEGALSAAEIVWRAAA